MPLSDQCVREIFKGPESGDGAAFLDHVADDVDRTVMSTHPLAGHYLCRKAFREGTFAKLGQVITGGTQLHVEHLIVKGNQAIVELHSLATARNGMCFDNYYCWVIYFRGEMIVRARAPILTPLWSPGCSRKIRSSDGRACFDACFTYTANPEA
jgi:uncharacterized protein